MDIISMLHEKTVYRRRINKLVELISSVLPQEASVLDIGCGDGRIDALINRYRPQVEIQGIDIMTRKVSFISVREFNGTTIPYEDNSFDIVILVDVLHHAYDQVSLLKEAARVTRDCILIKDHLNEGIFSRTTLKFMDYIGNARHGVSLPYNFLNSREWGELYEQAGLCEVLITRELSLYPWPFNWVFGRNLHFFSRLTLVNNNKIQHV
ncbi:MAG: class I SAM-dependent methyltransferase [Bacteroidota bacterium]